MHTLPSQGALPPWRARLHVSIFEADTPAGKAFDISLSVSIVLRVFVVMAESVGHIQQRSGNVFRASEWFFTGLFTVESMLRLLGVRRPLGYARSFFGLVDLLAILPTYTSLFLPGTPYLLVIRPLRVLRIFRVLKLAQYLSAAQRLRQALDASRQRSAVFLFTVSTLVVIIGALMYVIESEAHGFTSIPRSGYWAMVTLTTVGYGDIAPQTRVGQALAAVVMILGYGIIAGPTGIVTVDLQQRSSHPVSTQACPACAAEGHDPDAVYCKDCGARLYITYPDKSSCLRGYAPFLAHGLYWLDEGGVVDFIVQKLGYGFVPSDR